MIEPACQFQEKQDPRNRSPDRAREKAGHGKDHHMEPIFRRQKAKACSKVTVKATFMDDNTMLNYFVDVKVGDYFYDAVLWAAEKGITSGTDAHTSAPTPPAPARRSLPSCGVQQAVLSRRT